MRAAHWIYIYIYIYIWVEVVCGVLRFHALVVALDLPDAKHAPVLVHSPTALLGHAETPEMGSMLA
jgi:hypothetical protein